MEIAASLTDAKALFGGVPDPFVYIASRYASGNPLHEIYGGLFRYAPTGSGSSVNDAVRFTDNAGHQFVRVMHDPIPASGWYCQYADPVTGLAVDDLAAMQSLHSEFSSASVVRYSAVPHHLSAALDPAIAEQKILAAGATLDNTFKASAPGIKVCDLVVKGAPGPGFCFANGQHGLGVALEAWNCSGDGFVVGGENNAQVGWLRLEFCKALNNSGIGLHLDFDATTNAWCNAATFHELTSRGNGREGVKIVGRANFNVFDGNLQVESNAQSVASNAFHMDTAQHDGIGWAPNHNRIFGGFVNPGGSGKGGTYAGYGPTGLDNTYFGTRWNGTVSGITAG